MQTNFQVTLLSTLQFTLCARKATMSKKAWHLRCICGMLFVHMNFQVALLSELKPALSAREAARSVRPRVAQQVAAHVEPAATRRANVCPLHRMPLQVSRQMCLPPERTLALYARVSLHTVMDLFVNVSARFRFEPFPARLTLVFALDVVRVPVLH